MTDNSLKAPFWAWQFLRRNPKYQSDWSNLPPHDANMSRSPFPLTHQRPWDKEALKWGLLAYEHPNAETGRTAPFWAIGQMLEAEIVEPCDLPLLSMIRASGAQLSGLQLLDGGLALKFQRFAASVQILVPGGGTVKESTGLVLRLPLGLRLPVLLSRTRDIWRLVEGGTNERKRC